MEVFQFPNARKAMIGEGLINAHVGPTKCLSTTMMCVLNYSIQSSSLVGIRVAPSSPMVSHLLFAHDSLLLFKVSRENSKEVRNVLNLYCSASKQ